MSADQQRLNSAIQQIAERGPRVRALLEAHDHQGGKPSSAGVGSSSDAEGDRICCDGSTSGSANPGTDEREVGDSQSGLNSSDPADIGGGGGTLSGVTDCATGEPVCFDGAGFIPPDGWEEPNEPPLDSTYEEGYWWTICSYGLAGGCSGIYISANSAKDAHLAEKTGSLYDPPHCLVPKDDGYNLFTSPTDRANFPDDCSFFTAGIERRGCDGQAVCDEPPPTADQWPEDGCTNLAIKGGKIVGSKFDPENDGSYSAPRDSIDLCDNQGNQISLAPSASGGWKTINSTTDNGYLYNSKNERIAHIDGNEYSDPTI